MRATTQRPPLPARVYVYVALVVAAASIQIPLGWFVDGSVNGSTAVFEAAVLTALIALANRHPVHIGPRRKVNIGTAPEVAAVILLSGPLAALTLAVGTLIGEAALPARLIQRVFNVSVAMLRAVAGASAYAALLSLQSETIREPAAAIGAAVALYGTGTLLVIGIAAVQTGANPLKHAWAAQRQILMTEAALSLTGIMAAIAAEQYPWALALLIAPAVLARRALQEAEARFRRIFEHALDGIFQTGADGRIQAINPAAAQMLGYPSPQELMSEVRTLLQVYVDPADYQAHQVLLNIHGEVSNSEVQVRRRDGSVRWAVLSARVLRGPDRRVLSVEGIMNDITERKQAEQEREELLAREQAARTAAETAERAKSQFLSLLSHDLRSPLTSIKAFAQLLHYETTKPDASMSRLTEGLARIESGASRMDRMIEDLLDLARLEVGKPLELRARQTNIVTVLNKVLDEHQPLSERHKITLEAPTSELIGAWDSDRLERVFANLLSNAVKYSPAGGTIAVMAARERDADGMEWATITVRDEGIGIPAADLPHLFTQFHRAANVTGRITGNGLGLAGAKQIVEQHKGTLTVASTEAEGTTVTVRLPAQLAGSLRMAAVS